MPGGSVECRLDNASDTFIKSVFCSWLLDVAVLGWIFKDAFAEYNFHSSNDEDLVLKLPVAPLLSCLTIFTESCKLSWSGSWLTDVMHCVASVIALH
eukprot:s352_g16.t1